MARVKVYQNDDGQMIARLPGSGSFIPVTPDQLQVLQEGGLEAFANSAGNAIGQAATGATALGAGLLGAEETEAGAMEALQGLRQAQELRGAESPVAGFAGSIAPDAVLGALTGGAGTIGRRVLATGAVEGALGAARTPEAPWVAGALQGGLGAAVAGAGPLAGGAFRRAAANPVTERMVGGVRRAIGRTAEEGAEDVGRFARPVQADAPPGVWRSPSGETAMGAGQARRSAGAAATDAPEYKSGTMRSEGATSAAEMVDRYQFPLSTEDAAMIDATDDMTRTLARESKLEQWQRSRMDPTVMSYLQDGPQTNFRQLDAEQEYSVRRNLLSEIGRPDAQRLERGIIGENMERISADIDQVISQSGPVRTQPILDQWKALLKRRPNGPAANELKDWISQLEDLPRSADPKEVAAIRNEIGKAMEWAGRNEPEPRTWEHFGAARDMLDQELKKRWTPEMQSTFEELGWQWKLSQALVRGNKGAITDDGRLSLPTLMNNLRALDNAVKTGRKRDNEFVRFLETASMVQSVRGPESGTPAGIAAGLRQMGWNNTVGRLPMIGEQLRMR